jgi:UDP-N-acetylmuramoyl-L-alanyl-D-glutamate--2,6-diaminopimelate ligase
MFQEQISQYLTSSAPVSGYDIVENLKIDGQFVHASNHFNSVVFNAVTSHSQRLLEVQVYGDQPRLFCAMNGQNTDGKEFINVAIKHGASGIIYEHNEGAAPPLSVPFLTVKSSHRALSRIGALFAGQQTSNTEPQKQKIIGVTGTNGKTTSVHLLLQYFELLGIKGASIGTLGLKTSKQAGALAASSSLTTPDTLLVHSWLRELRQRKVSHIGMEVSSHALQQHRVSDVIFNVGLFTNLSQDHLDYHGSIEVYRDVKFELFRMLQSGSAILNLDDPVGKLFASRLQESSTEVLGIGCNKAAIFQIVSIALEKNFQNIEFLFLRKRYQVRSPLLGNYNAYNLIGVIAAAYVAGISIDDLCELAPKLSQAPGRLELFQQGGISVYVDYAHTPDALLNVLLNVRLLTNKRVWTVFGCGGDRDRLKRPLMLENARKNSDVVVITTDNPRTESPDQIVADMISTGINPDKIEYDRAKAIHYAIKNAQNGDVIVIAGKGHEEYQILGTKKNYFSDQKVIAEAFEELRCDTSN